MDTCPTAGVHLVVVWNAQQLPEIVLSLLNDVAELLASVTHFHNTGA